MGNDLPKVMAWFWGGTFYFCSADWFLRQAFPLQGHEKQWCLSKKKALDREISQISEGMVLRGLLSPAAICP